jgi:hypothetical protein
LIALLVDPFGGGVVTPPFLDQLAATIAADPPASLRDDGSQAER